MKVLLTGHHGYIGAVTAPLFEAAGHTVVGLDTFFYEGCDLVPDAPPARALHADVRDVEAGQLEGFDGVVHLAALSNDPIGELSPRLTAEINFEATVGLARAARAAGVSRFVFASSCSMYGASGTDAPVDESAPLRPLSAYAESKVRAEEALAALADGAFSPVFMRNATAYGVSPRMRVDIVLNNLVAWAYTTGAIRIMSDGTPWRPLVHAEDIGRAALAALEAPRDVVHAQAFNVGREGENYRVRELAEIVREAVGGCAIEYAGTGDPDPRSYRVDFGKLARAFPDLALRWTAASGAREILAAYRANGLTREEFEGHRYVRLQHLKLLLADDALDSNLRWRDAYAASR
ncbi:MAG: NAD(P)-dependent oxidoreductase [Thermoleophilia bacterium]|nr:NAD(P)-dependent oxidoreductase [Thermoleophilia bacterium]